MKDLIRLFYLLTTVALVVFAVTSCSKKSGKNNTPPTPTDNLTSKPWKYDTSGVDINGDGKIDIGGDTSTVELCSRDDFYTFNKDKSGSANTGTQHCTVGEAQTTAFTWSLTPDNKTLSASFNAVLQQGVTLLTLDADHLSGYRDTTVLGLSYRIIVQLKH